MIILRASTRRDGRTGVKNEVDEEMLRIEKPITFPIKAFVVHFNAR